MQVYKYIYKEVDLRETNAINSVLLESIYRPAATYILLYMPGMNYCTRKNVGMERRSSIGSTLTVKSRAYTAL